MPFFDHLKGDTPETKFITLAYGRHLVSGHLAKSKVVGASPTHVITIQQALGMGEWSFLEDVYFRGLRIDPSKWVLYPGIRPASRTDAVQGVDSVFSTDVPHNSVAWARVELPAGVGDVDAKGSPPAGFTAIAKTKKVANYNTSGAETAYAYSANPARIVADLLIKQGGIPISRIDWTSWAAWRDFCDAAILCDYTAIAGFRGFGLWAQYYSGTNFTTLVRERVDPYIEWASTTGAPASGIGVDNFSMRYEGRIRPNFTETYTFKTISNGGVNLWVNGHLLIDAWANDGSTNSGTRTQTISLTARTFYDIKLEANHGTGSWDLVLKWSSASRVEEVIPDYVLWPKPVNRTRYEAHPFWSQPTRLDDAILQVLALCNSTYQEADGKLVFFAFDQTTGSSFAFTNDNIIDGSVKYIPREPTALRNFWPAKLRDIDSQYLEEPLVPVIYEQTALIDTVGRKIEGEAFNFFNTTRWQAHRVLKAIADRASASLFTIELSGLADTYQVLPGDRVTVAVEFLNQTALDCLTLSATDASGEQSADTRNFTLKGIPPAETEPTPPTAPPTNVALATAGSTATASSEDSATYGAAKAINASRHPSSGYWNSTNSVSPPQWLAIDFGQSRTISEINVITVADAYTGTADPTLTDTFTLYGLTDYAVQKWTGSAWADITTVASNDKVWRQFTFTAISTTKIRIYATGFAGGAARLTEVEAWGY